VDHPADKTNITLTYVMGGTMNDDLLQRELDAFDKDPKAAMNRVPLKMDDQDRVIESSKSAFSRADIADGAYVYQRDKIRRTFDTVINGVLVSLENAMPGKAPTEDNDRPGNLVDELRYEKPADVDAANLSKAQLAESPWSDDYWAIYLGILGKRYADPSFPNAEDWQANFEYIRTQPAAAIVASGDAASIDRLSPSEKYDLLVGDPRGTLTSAMWREGQSYYDHSGRVETWMGICHGWAPAAYMLPRPRRIATVLAADGKTQLRFYPSDIKALASLLWANARTVSKFIGSRSNDKNPKTDENGRVTSSEVFDTNPGAWHLAVINQIGACKRGMVMDATYDYEVWNQPVFAYEYRYFNPQTMKLAPNLREATVARGDFKRDRFSPYRSSDYKAAAGVAMTVRYVVETTPSHAPEDSPARDKIQKVTYKYDLELDGEGKILGGEWYINRHPDFLWTPPPGARAIAPWDHYATQTWNVREPLPRAFRRAALSASASGLPLAHVVEGLLGFANS
jgi:hypothetical protein